MHARGRRTVCAIFFTRSPLPRTHLIWTVCCTRTAALVLRHASALYARTPSLIMNPRRLRDWRAAAYAHMNVLHTLRNRSVLRASSLFSGGFCLSRCVLFAHVRAPHFWRLLPHAAAWPLAAAWRVISSNNGRMKRNERCQYNIISMTNQ